MRSLAQRAIFFAAVVTFTGLTAGTAASTARADELRQGPVLAEPGFTLPASSWKDAAKAAGRPFLVFNGRDRQFHAGAYNGPTLDKATLAAVLPTAFVAVQPSNVFSGTKAKWPEFEDALHQMSEAVPTLAIGIETHSQGATVVVPKLVGYLKDHPNTLIGNVHLNAPLTRGSFMGDAGSHLFPLKVGREAAAEMRSGTTLEPAVRELGDLVHGTISMATPDTARTIVRGEDGKLHLDKGGDGFVTRKTNTIAGIPNAAIHSTGKGLVWKILDRSPVAHLMSNRGPEATAMGTRAMAMPLHAQLPFSPPKPIALAGTPPKTR